MKRIFFALLFLACITTAPRAEPDAEWVSVKQVVPIADISPEEARTIALRQARVKAVEQVCGIHLQNETMVRQGLTSGLFAMSTVYGHVVEEKIRREVFRFSADTESPPACSSTGGVVEVSRTSPQQPARLDYLIEADMRVRREAGQPDPSFKVSVNLNRAAYQSGDAVEATIKATKDCYITVLNIQADDTVRLLMPTPSLKNNFLRGGSEMRIPDPSEARLRVMPMPGHDQDQEWVVVIATLTRMDLLLGSEFTILDLQRWLASVPMSMRAQSQAGYVITSK